MRSGPLTEIHRYPTTGVHLWHHHKRDSPSNRLYWLLPSRFGLCDSEPRARTSFVFMSVTCSEKDCRSFLDGERDEFGTSTDMSGEGRESKKEENFSLSPSLTEGLYMSATRQTETPSVCQMTASSGVPHRLFLARLNGSKCILVTCH